MTSTHQTTDSQVEGHMSIRQNSAPRTPTNQPSDDRSEDSMEAKNGKLTTAENALAGIRKDLNKSIKKHSSMQAMRTAAKAEIAHRNPHNVS